MSQSLPTTLGKYQIIREIARSNDIVYEAYDPGMNRRVAVKELNMPSNLSDAKKEERLKRFMREARAAGSLIHPNIVTIYEVGESEGRTFIAMEYLDGRNLRQEMDSQGFLTEERALEIGLEVLKGLTYAHENGVIHRDIKPENIQLLSNGTVKLTDFGIARLTFEPNLTMDGQIFGTPSYMSPEQINGKDLDARSDLFSVGIILYEMISGQKPFQGDNVMAISYAIMNSTPTQPQQASSHVWSVIQRALDKSPTMRQPNTHEFIREVKGCIAGLRAGDVVIDPVLPVQTQQPWGQPPAAQPVIYPPSYNYNQPQAPSVPYQPYNPYGAANPAPPQPVPGGHQPYNPYGAPAGQPGGPPNLPFPVYYPPPPRRPLVSAETKQSVARFFLVLLILGTILIGLIIGVNALVNASSESLDPTASADRSEIGLNFDEARGYVSSGVQEADATRRKQYWSQAASIWSQAIAENPQLESTYREEAAISFLEAADFLSSQGKSVPARNAAGYALYFAKGFFPSLVRRAEAYGVS